MNVLELNLALDALEAHSRSATIRIEHGANTRPNPDELLARVSRRGGRKARGKLKIFFGCAAGVGKTYSMLEAARAKRAGGVDVVRGLRRAARPPGDRGPAAGPGAAASPSASSTAASALEEFDLDAALARKPGLMLVDELAHTNAPGSRHAKRWQDVQELLDAGIDVYTTLNVQHLESLNDIVAQITGVTGPRDVPDSCSTRPTTSNWSTCRRRNCWSACAEGKVYVPAQAERAMEHFFRVPNLIALRELALRRTADRVNAQVQSTRQDQAGGTQIWPTTERLLVCVGPSPSSARLIRAARRLATGLRAEWIAVVRRDTGPGPQGPGPAGPLVQHLRMAEQLGAETITLSGQNLAEEIVAYARARNVTKIVIGKPVRPRWKDLVLGGPVDDLVRISGDIDIYVIRGDGTHPESSRPAPASVQAPLA